MAKRKRLTFEMANRILSGNRRERGMYSLHNTGTQYEIRDASGLVVAAFEEYLDATAWIRRQRPDLPPWSMSFAPQAEDERVKS